MVGRTCVPVCFSCGHAYSIDMTPATRASGARKRDAGLFTLPRGQTPSKRLSVGLAGATLMLRAGRAWQEIQSPLSWGQDSLLSSSLSMLGAIPLQTGGSGALPRCCANRERCARWHHHSCAQPTVPAMRFPKQAHCILLAHWRLLRLEAVLAERRLAGLVRASFAALEDFTVRARSQYPVSGHEVGSIRVASFFCALGCDEEDNKLTRRGQSAERLFNFLHGAVSYTHLRAHET